MTPLSPFQQQCLRWIGQALSGKPWLPPSYVMAHIRIESGWNPEIHSADGLGSIGLMQVLPATAAEMGFSGADQANPQISISTGVAYLAWLRQYLMRHWGFSKTILYKPVCMAYNEGPGNIVAGRRDPAYYMKWAAARQAYAFADTCDLAW